MADETMADKTMADKTMADETMADETMADETMADKAMADKAMADETMADETIADETIADGESDKNIQIWKLKKLIKGLEAARGNGTSMISLIMSPSDQISRVTKMLEDEFGTASNIISRVNRESMLGTFTSAQQMLKRYNEVPPNGLVLYSGTILTDDGKEKKVSLDFEPFRPINVSQYICDNKFHTEALNELLESDDKYGFIVMDRNGVLFGTLSGNTYEVLHKLTSYLLRYRQSRMPVSFFNRLRNKMLREYILTTANLAFDQFINPATGQPNVAGLILAGKPNNVGCMLGVSDDFRTELSHVLGVSDDFRTELIHVLDDSDDFRTELSHVLGVSDDFRTLLSHVLDPHLQAKILNVVDVSYGGESGFRAAIDLSAEILPNVKFFQEERLIRKFFEEISQNTCKYIYGVDKTLDALEKGAVETLIVWENLDINRYVLKNAITGEIVLKHMKKEQEADQSNFRDAATNADLDVQEKMPLPEWFANEYKKFRCSLEFVNNKSQEGSQFCRGFGGIGGILRYAISMPVEWIPDDELCYMDSDGEYW